MEKTMQKIKDLNFIFRRTIFYTFNVKLSFGSHRNIKIFARFSCFKIYKPWLEQSLMLLVIFLPHSDSKFFNWNLFRKTLRIFYDGIIFMHLKFSKTISFSSCFKLYYSSNSIKLVKFKFNVLFLSWNKM